MSNVTKCEIRALSLQWQSERILRTSWSPWKTSNYRRSLFPACHFHVPPIHPTFWQWEIYPSASMGAPPLEQRTYCSVSNNHEVSWRDATTLNEAMKWHRPLVSAGTFWCQRPAKMPGVWDARCDWRTSTYKSCVPDAQVTAPAPQHSSRSHRRLITHST